MMDVSTIVCFTFWTASGPRHVNEYPQRRFGGLLPVVLDVIVGFTVDENAL